MLVTSGDFGPVLVLSGESDISAAAELTVLIMQLAAGARHLTVDLSGLRFADSASIQAFIRADRALKASGGTLVLLAPQPVVARVLTLLGVDQLITVHPGPDPGTGEDASVETGRSGSGQFDEGFQPATG